MKLPVDNLKGLLSPVRIEEILKLFSKKSLEIASSNKTTDYLLFGSDFSEEREVINKGSTRQQNKYYNKIQVSKGSRALKNDRELHHCNNIYMNEAIRKVLFHVEDKLVKAKLMDKSTIHTPVVGFLKNKKEGDHQELHLDNCAKNDVRASGNNIDLKTAFILHVPLSEEGLMLRVPNPETIKQLESKDKHGNWTYNTLKEDFVFVPIGEALILRDDIYHAGNYGSEGNIRFHAMIKHQDHKILITKLYSFEGKENIKNYNATKIFKEKSSLKKTVA